mgnify:CR=1 FL=1
MMKKLQLLKKQEGFTLVELLAVIVILAIIAAIAVPSIGHLINKSKDNAKVAEAIQIISAAKTYVAAENGQLNFNENNRATIKEADLAPYIDNLDNKDWKVIVTKDADNKYTYKINNHPAAGIVKSGATTATEDQLLDYSK